MSDCMNFPDDWREFLRDYSFKDSDEVYTNGAELIPVFRVEQLIEHLLKEQEPRVLTLEQEPIKVERRMEETEWNVCGNCGSHVIHKWAYCPYCGKRLKWND